MSDELSDFPAADYGDPEDSDSQPEPASSHPDEPEVGPPTLWVPLDSSRIGEALREAEQRQRESVAALAG